MVSLATIKIRLYKPLLLESYDMLSDKLTNVCIYMCAFIQEKAWMDIIQMLTAIVFSDC